MAKVLGVGNLGNASEATTSTIAAVFYAISHRSTFFIHGGLFGLLTDGQMSKGCAFSLLNGEQMSNKVGVEHQPSIWRLD